MGHNVQKNWETDVIDCSSTTVAEKIAVLRCSESITLKSLASAGSFHYVGMQSRAKDSKGFKLEGGESMTLTLPKEFGEGYEIEIWALPTTAGDDITYFKLMDFGPVTEAS